MNKLALRSSLLLLAACAGCSFKPSRVLPPAIDPAAAAAAAMKEYDADGDGKLSSEELKKCPGILAAIQYYDKNSDGAVSREEIQQRLQERLDSGLGMMAFSCGVKLDGRPLEGATLKFVPEAFQGGAIPPASGVSDAAGMAVISIDVADLPEGDKDLQGLMRPGIYKVEVTHPSRKLPARFNTETTLGQEVSNETVMDTVFFELSSN